jgi:hypothetical protein
MCINAEIPHRRRGGLALRAPNGGAGLPVARRRGFADGRVAAQRTAEVQAAASSDRGAESRERRR